MSARIVDGWLEVPCDGSERALVEISADSVTWLPAFLDYVDGRRVAKVRPPAGALTPAAVAVRINGALSTPQLPDDVAFRTTGRL